VARRQVRAKLLLNSVLLCGAQPLNPVFVSEQRIAFANTRDGVFKDFFIVFGYCFHAFTPSSISAQKVRFTFLP
jgi:hypothetical protein